MKSIQKPKLSLNKKTVSVLSNAQQEQVKGGLAAAANGTWWHSAWGCDTITCCSVPFCSVWDCNEQTS